MKVQRPPFPTYVYDTPANWDFERYGLCSALPVMDVDGVKYSYWKPSWLDRLRILFGRNVRLAVICLNHPPVMVDTEI